MRTFMDGNGNDSTGAVMAYLASNKQLRIADLYLIGELEDPTATFLTDWSSDLSWPVFGTFKAATINRGGITSQVGFQVDTLDVTWSAKLTAFGTSPSTANPYQKAQSGFYDNQKFRLWRTLMPEPGDANTFGACEWFGGRVASAVVQRGSIKFTINSFLDVVNQKVPPNVIELSNSLAGYVGATPVLADAETKVPTFTTIAPSSTDVIIGDTIQPTAHKIYGTDAFIRGFMVFAAGSTLAGFWSPVAHNLKRFVIGTGNFNEFDVFAPFPWAPTPGDVFYVSTAWPVDLASAQAVNAAYFGFPFVPVPESAI